MSALFEACEAEIAKLDERRELLIATINEINDAIEQLASFKASYVSPNGQPRPKLIVQRQAGPPPGATETCGEAEARRRSQEPRSDARRSAADGRRDPSASSGNSQGTGSDRAD